MRLFGVPNGSVDRYDRASWLTMPFDLALESIVTGPFYIDAADVFVAGGVQSELFVAGGAEANVFRAGAVAAEVQ